MVGRTVSLRFIFKQSPLIKGSNLYKDRTYSTDKKQHLLKQKRAMLALHFLENQSAHFQ